MLSERAMIKIRWLALGSALAVFAIMNVKQMRGLLLVAAAGVLYNLVLSSSRQSDAPEVFKGLSTMVDFAGLAVLIFFTGGPQSVFVLYMAVFLFTAAVRHGLGVGFVFSVIAGGGLSYYFLNEPTAAMQSAVFTRLVVFLLAPVAAMLLDFTSGEAQEIESPEEVEAGVEDVKAEVAEPEPKREKPLAAAEPLAVAKPAEPKKPAEPEKPAIAIEAEAPTVAKKPEEVAAEILEELAAMRDSIKPAEPVVPEEPPVPEIPTQAAAPKEPAAEPKPEVEDQSREVAGASTLAEEVRLAQEETTPPGAIEAKILREKINELAILHEASKALGASLIMEEVMDTVVDIAAKGLQADIAGALIFDDKTGFLKIAGLRGLSGEEREVIKSATFSPGEGILGEVFLKKKTQNFIDLSAERPGSAPFNGRVKSFLVTPLATDGFEIGVLFLGKYIKEPFSASAEEFIETISGQATIAFENAKLYSQAQELAIHNGLTGIYNYRYFMKQLEEEIKRSERYGRSVGLMMIDIDLFKHVNDSFGHQRGDEVLRGLAQTLVNTTRETDVVARYGGEEFCVVLPETNLEDTLEVAEKLRSSVAKASYAREKGNSIKITISIGVASFPGVAVNQEDLLKKADDALYTAKTKRNTVISAGAGQQHVK